MRLSLPLSHPPPCGAAGPVPTSKTGRSKLGGALEACPWPGGGQRGSGRAGQALPLHPRAAQGLGCHGLPRGLLGQHRAGQLSPHPTHATIARVTPSGQGRAGTPSPLGVHDHVPDTFLSQKHAV
ncbi:hypothetical protein GHT09_006351 [Marmota monax]|uniref:Uncharacterized protein n=1 Tax=Marmota monax TaxID=9995 RepID=A0A834PSB5_MARMO|nr:hypothetical protein GHT09_006351 [Marmota monax]